MANDNIIESIHRFLLDDMEGDEKTTFENELASNEAIKKQITMEQRFLKGIEYVADAELKSNISNVHDSLKQKGFFKEEQTGGAKIINMKKRTTSRRLFAVAAALVALVAAWFVFNNSDANLDTEEIYSNHYQIEKSITYALIDKTNPAFIDPADSKSKQLYLALDQYKNGEYTAALNYLDGLNEEFPEDKQVAFYKGLSNIGIGNTDKAIKLLTPLTESGFEYHDAAKWYLSLSFIKTNKLIEAKKILNDLTQKNIPPYAEKAKKLLADLSP